MRDWLRLRHCPVVLRMRVSIERIFFTLPSPEHQRSNNSVCFPLCGFCKVVFSHRDMGTWALKALMAKKKFKNLIKYNNINTQQQQEQYIQVSTKYLCHAVSCKSSFFVHSPGLASHRNAGRRVRHIKIV